MIATEPPPIASRKITNRAGIEVSGRIALHGPVNADNRRYLTAKATRAGHKLDHLFAALAEPAETSDEPVADNRAP